MPCFLGVSLAAEVFSPAAQANGGLSLRAWERALAPETVSEEIPGMDPEPEALPLADELSARVRILVYRRPVSFDHEFALLIEEGRIQRAFVVSTARRGRRPILGKFRLGVPEFGGAPWPWRVSAKYGQSPMYWALQVQGGYFIHSSPHYGNLGAPASNGCIRTSYPDAMEVFDAVVNRSGGRPAVIELNDGLELGSDSPEERTLLQLLQSSGWTVSDLEEALVLSFSEVRAVSNADVEYAPGVAPDAHVRPFAGISEKKALFPLCGQRDCWERFGRARKILRLRPEVIFREPKTHSRSFRGRRELKAGARIFLDRILAGGVASLDPFLIRELRVRVEGSKVSPVLRFCDLGSGFCTRPHGLPPHPVSRLSIPLAGISEKLHSGEGWYLEVLSGQGWLEAAEAVYFKD